jgi:hypothetical protein
MLLKSYHHLHALPQTKSSFTTTFYEDNNLDIFEMVVGTNESTKELVNWELMIFHRFHVDAKEIKCPLEYWWKKHQSMFPTIRDCGFSNRN